MARWPLDQKQGNAPLSYKEVVMLTLSFRDGDYAFVFYAGIAVGAMQYGDHKPGGKRSRLPVRFAGRKEEFEILRPSAVERRYGRQELEKLTDRFLS
jgi:hypothetical protein